MKYQFKTNSPWLRARFKLVRRRLVGQSPRVKTVYRSHYDISNWLKARPGQWLLNGLIFVSLLILALLYLPLVYYRLSPPDIKPLVAFPATHSSPTNTAPLPAVDPLLPEGKWLIIPRIGVRTQLQATSDAQQALTKGVWQVPGYGQPGDTTQPLILVAHRYGWQWWWQTDYWKYNSFYLLPDTKPGDLVEIVADQRKWVYQIYGGGEGEAINDYEADLILYTCKFLNSPVRHFRYAKLVDLGSDTQSINIIND